MEYVALNIVSLLEPEIAKLTHVVNQQTSACLAADGNTFPELRDNIQGYVAAAAVNYNQGNSVYRPLVINPELDERVEETLTDHDLAEYTIKVLPPLVQKSKPPSQRDFVLNQRDPLHPNIPYPSRMLKQKQQEKDEVQIYKFWQMFKQLHVNITLADALILMPKYQKMLKALLSNKEKLQELANTPLNEISQREVFPEDLFSTNQSSGNPTFSSHPELTSPEVKDDIFDPEGGNFDIESDLKEIEYLLHHDHIKYSIFKDLIDQSNLADLNDNVVESMPEMFTDEHALDYSSPPLFDEYDDDLFEVESDAGNVYNDPFDSKGEKIKESKLLIDELDIPYDFLLPFDYDSILSEDFSKVDALPLTNNEDKVFNPGILIQENLFEIITSVAQDKKLVISHASLMIEYFDPPLYELPFFKEVPRSNMLLLFTSENEEKVFKLGIHTSGKVHSSLISELSHQGYKVYKINQIFKSPMKIFLFSYGKDTHIMVVPCLHFYPLDQF
uniref:Reverse transcriptase domain-containing protein n=1 Tax=Tanacetum cinerariifolium TaxID=118510 RepID=A0A6L2M9K6_TANCI|nr:reverse transcriptase domain-containing protein [Tanacetum cinerariifolium]